MKNIITHFLGLLCILNFSVLRAQEIIWMRADFPPVAIVEGQFKDQGYADAVERHLISSLPEYQHKRSVAGFARIHLSTKLSNNICNTASLKAPGREEYMEFSIPAYVLYPKGLIVKKSTIPQLEQYIDNNNTIDLESLLKEGSFVVGLSKSRRYSKKINEIISQYLGSKQLYERAGRDALEGLINMLMLKRGMGGILGASAEIQYIARKIGVKSNELVFLSVKGDTPYLLGYVTCSKSKLGKEVISKVNKLLETARKTLVVERYEYWLDDGAKLKYRDIVNEAYK